MASSADKRLIFGERFKFPNAPILFQEKTVIDERL